tara:strand:+ start:562 stop:792 length:231 start_codon:yes stop_codon:yes gene_type:complete
MAVQPTKMMFFRLNDDLELKLSVPLFVLVSFVLILITMFSNIFALLTFPLFLAIIFAAVSEKIDYRFDNQSMYEEE